MRKPTPVSIKFLHLCTIASFTDVVVMVRAGITEHIERLYLCNSSFFDKQI